MKKLCKIIDLHKIKNLHKIIDLQWLVFVN